MRILLVGAGGVGSAFTAIAARRDFFELCVVADYDEARVTQGGRRAGGRPVRGRARSTPPTPARSRRSSREHQITHVMNAVDPRFVMPIFDGAFAGGADYLDMAMCLSKPHPETPYDECGVKLGDEQFAKADGVGGARAGWPWSASVSSPGSPTCSRATPPTTCSPRSTSSAPATGPTSRSATPATSLRAVVLHLDHDRGVPEPARDLGEGPRAGSPRRRSASRRSSTSPRASARSSASTWSTRRCC